MVSASVFAVSSQRPCVTIAKLASSSPHSKDITCHENAGFARTMICLSRLAIELCLLLNIMRNGQQIKGVMGNLQGLSSRAQPGLLGDILPSQSAQPGEDCLSQTNLSSFSWPRTWPQVICNPQAAPPHCWVGSPYNQAAARKAMRND